MKRLLTFLALGGVAAAVVKFTRMRREFTPATEGELRERVRRRFEGRIPAEKMGEVEDKVVGFARRKGRLIETNPPAPEPAEE